MGNFKAPSKADIQKRMHLVSMKEEDPDLYTYIQDRASGVAESIYALVEKAEVDKGGLILLTGSGRSGKSTALLRLCQMVNKSGGKLRMAKPVMHRSDIVDGIIQTYDGEWQRAEVYQDHESLKTLFTGDDVLAIDDIMFSPYAIQAYLISMIKEYVQRGHWVIGSGYLWNANGNEFLLTQLLKYRADIHFEMRAMCFKCGERTAEINQRLVNGVPASMEDDEQVQSGGDVMYEPRCMGCHVYFHGGAK